MPNKASRRAKKPPGEKNQIGDLCEAVACGVITCNSAGKITACSPEAGNFIRPKTGATLGRPVAILPAALRKIIRPVLAGKKATVTRQVKLSVRGQDAVTLRVRCLAMAGAKKKKPGAIILLDDLAAARWLQQNLARLDRLVNIGTVSTSLAHEIKNGMVAIKTFVDLLLEKNQDAELAEVVSRELKRIGGLANQMLRAAHPTKAGLAPVPVHELLDHSLRLVQRQMDEKSIVLRRSFKATADVIQGNSHQLEQAFMNLLLNALEAMGLNGELTVQTESLPAADKQPARLSLTFSDTGVGIPPENLEQVFNTFFTTKQDGTGLGLAITRRIVLEHDGEVSVESRPNSGATFRLVLPLAKT